MDTAVSSAADSVGEAVDAEEDQAWLMVMTHSVCAW